MIFTPTLKAKILNCRFRARENKEVVLGNFGQPFYSTVGMHFCTKKCKLLNFDVPIEYFTSNDRHFGFFSNGN